MAKKKKTDKRDIYLIRTLSYYQLKGGIYNEIITLLMQFRDKYSQERSLPIARFLNDATFITDQCREAQFSYEKFEELFIFYRGIYPSTEFWLLLGVVYVLISEEDSVNNELVEKLDGKLKCHTKLYEPFEKLHRLWKEKAIKTVEVEKEEKAVKEEKAKLLQYIQDLENKNERLTNALTQKDAELVDARKVIKEKDTIIRFMEEDRQVNDNPTLDDVFTFENTLQYIQTRQHYSFCSQIFGMVKDLMMSNRNLVTDDQYNLLSAVEQQMLNRKDDQHVVNINYNFGGLVMQGVIESDEFKELMKSPYLPIGKEPKDIARDMIKLYLKHGRSEEEQSEGGNL